MPHGHFHAARRSKLVGMNFRSHAPLGTGFKYALGIIGGADGPTAIIVSGPGIDVPLVMLMIAAAAVVLAVIGIVRYLLKNAKK